MPGFTFQGKGKMSGKTRGRPKGSKNKTKNPGLLIDFSKKVKKVVNRMSEKRQQNFASTMDVGAYTSAIVANMIIPISPYGGFISISQGDGQGNRQGNRIRTHSAVLKGVIYPNPYNATTNPNPGPFDIRMWFFSVKNSATRPTTLPGFFQAGSSSQTPVGDLTDMTRVINQDVYTYRGHRTYKLGAASYNAPATGELPAFSYQSNNDYKFNIIFSIDITKMLAKEYKFSDTNNTGQSSVFFWIEAVYARGGAQASTTLPAQMAYEITYTYTDL